VIRRGWAVAAIAAATLIAGCGSDPDSAARPTSPPGEAAQPPVAAFQGTTGEAQFLQVAANVCGTAIAGVGPFPGTNASKAELSTWRLHAVPAADRLVHGLTVLGQQRPASEPTLRALRDDLTRVIERLRATGGSGSTDLAPLAADLATVQTEATQASLAPCALP
jgi:hypothetical protein